MADDDIWGLTETQFANFRGMERLYLKEPNGSPGNPNGPPTSFDERQPIVAVLLDPLECGQSVYAAVLRKQSANTIQIVTSYGQPAGGYFRLGFQPEPGGETQWTPYFYPLLDDASVLQGYVAGLRSIGRGNVQVTLGLFTTPEPEQQHNTWRWSIAFCGKFEGLQVPMLKVESFLEGGAILVQANNPLEYAGYVELINEVVGVPTPTPLRAGARVLAVWVAEIGYVPVSAEIRDFGDAGLFDDMAV